LTPNIQWLLAETKVYQRQQNYRFFWVKNFVALLRDEWTFRHNMCYFLQRLR
jgi:hypothetical protein